MTPTIASLIACIYWSTAPQAVCSFYGESWDGLETASGLIYDCTGMTAAHCTIPQGSIILMRNNQYGNWCRVRVIDTGPWKVDAEGNAVYPLEPHPTRQFDLSRAAFRHLSGDNLDDGLMTVSWRVIDRDITGMLYRVNDGDPGACNRENLSTW